ncbi:hypothetical protein H5410_046178 [Solanum commersonii]|uniref:Uncharacterized protein n=1 Tax=Solanum commersonii TaxID=4109 RepID=A0A9J5XFT4_SOLCO|nr:hypothetical protein H5410_046178 [Solanum commersonii]
MCLPKHEGGLGFRSMFDVSKTMHEKLWLNLRTKDTMWSNFMWKKYCKKQISALVQWKGRSQIWKYMLENRGVLEQYMWWEPREGISTIWYDKWSNMGPLNVHAFEVHTAHPIKEIGEFLKENGWDYSAMREFIPDYVLDHVQTNLHPAYLSNQGDKAWWTETNNGKFTIKSAWEFFRLKKDTVEDMAKLWIKGVPFKILFLNLETLFTCYWNCGFYVQFKTIHKVVVESGRKLQSEGSVSRYSYLYLMSVLGINDTISKFIQIRFKVQCNNTSWPYILQNLNSTDQDLPFELLDGTLLLLISLSATQTVYLNGILDHVILGIIGVTWQFLKGSVSCPRYCKHGS